MLVLYCDTSMHVLSVIALKLIAVIVVFKLFYLFHAPMQQVNLTEQEAHDDPLKPSHYRVAGHE